MDFVGNLVQSAAEQTDGTTMAEFLAAAVRAGKRLLEAIPDEKIFGQVCGNF